MAILTKMGGSQRLGVLAALALVALAACAQQTTLEECEEGVSDLGRVTTVAPPTC